MGRIKLTKYDIRRGIKLPQEISEDLAYLCGVFAGDGSMGFRKNKHEYSIKCVGNPRDEKDFYFNIIKPKFKNVFGLDIQVKPMDKGTTFGFRIFSKSLVFYLTQIIGLPLGKKYDTLKIPEIFMKNEKFLINFIRGIFDTDGCITFKRGHLKHPYYPVISLSSKSEDFIKEICQVLWILGFKFSKSYRYKINDERFRKGFSIINRIDLNGKYNFNLWNKKVSFFSPKHLNKIRKNEKSSEGWI